MPVTLITGYLGAGKTTLVNWVLTARHGFRCAVLLNEIADSADIERALVKEPEVLSSCPPGRPWGPLAVGTPPACGPSGASHLIPQGPWCWPPLSILAPPGAPAGPGGLAAGRVDGAGERLHLLLSQERHGQRCARQTLEAAELPAWEGQGLCTSVRLQPAGAARGSHPAGTPAAAKRRPRRARPRSPGVSDAAARPVRLRAHRDNWPGQPGAGGRGAVDGRAAGEQARGRGEWSGGGGGSRRWQGLRAAATWADRQVACR